MVVLNNGGYKLSTPYVHWNATGMPLVDPVNTGIPLGDTNEYSRGTLEHHLKNLVEAVPYWNATGESVYCSLHWNTTGGT